MTAPRWKICGLFATPDSADAVQDWINRLPADQRATATTASMMMFNFCAVAHNETLDALEIDPADALQQVAETLDALESAE